MLSDKPFLRELKKQIKRFEVALRNFEIVYIDMLKTLKVKIMDIDSDQKFDQESIQMRSSRRNSKVKLYDNQLFDQNGSLLNPPS